MTFATTAALCAILSLIGCAADGRRDNAVPEGCYELMWRDAAGALDTMFPRQVRVLGGPSRGSLAPGRAAAETTAFWQIHPSRYWTRVPPDSVELWFGHQSGGTRARVVVTADSLNGLAFGIGDVDPWGGVYPTHIVSGRPAQCELVGPAT